MVGVFAIASAALGLPTPVDAPAAVAQSGALPYTCFWETFLGQTGTTRVEISGSALAPTTAEIFTDIDVTDLAVSIQFDPAFYRDGPFDFGNATLGPNATEIVLGDVQTVDGLAAYSGISARVLAAGNPGTTMVISLDQVVHQTFTSSGLLLGTITCTPDGDPVVLAEVELTGQANFCEAPCSLGQVVEFDAVGDALTMAQAGAGVALETVTLDGAPQLAGALLNDVTVTNRRGDGASWSLTGQVTDFKADAGLEECPAGDESTWQDTCIPGDNLGWSPNAGVAHDAVVGDVAVVAEGETVSSGLGSAALSLCTSSSTQAGGTFTCGAALSLVTPASAAAEVYTATLTLTLA